MELDTAPPSHVILYTNKLIKLTQSNDLPPKSCLYLGTITTCPLINCTDKRQNHQGKRRVESCLCVPDLTQKWRMRSWGQIKSFFFIFLANWTRMYPNYWTLGRTGSGTDSFLSVLGHGQTPKRKYKYLYPNSKRQQAFFTRSQYKESLDEREQCR